MVHISMSIVSEEIIQDESQITEISDSGITFILGLRSWRQKTFYRYRVRSLAMLVTHSLTDSLTH